MRCRILVTSCKAPSAVWTRDTPSFALRIAWSKPRICEVIRLEMARPAASSLAELTRWPEDKRSVARSRAFPEFINWRCEFKEATLVLMTKGIINLLMIVPVHSCVCCDKPTDEAQKQRQINCSVCENFVARLVRNGYQQDFYTGRLSGLLHRLCQEKNQAL